eukprot:1149165-Pelagomonas_calceolata.AAC.1
MHDGVRLHNGINYTRNTVVLKVKGKNDLVAYLRLACLQVEGSVEGGLNNCTCSKPSQIVRATGAVRPGSN